MNKFKFGDKVWHETFGECSVLTLDDDIENIYKIVYLDENEDYIAYAHISKLTPATDWIPCSERMPELNVPVLVHTGSGMRIDKAYDFGDGVSFYEDLYGDVTHWMPLPALPQD